MLVFLFWLSITFITLISTIILTIFLLKIKIEIKELNIKYKENNKNNKIEFYIQIKGYIFKFIKIFSIKINNNKAKKYLKKIKKLGIYEKILKRKTFNKKSLKKMQNFYRTYKNKYQKNPITIEKINLNAEIGLINLETTSAIIATLGTVLAIPLIFLKKEDYKYKICANYEENKIINVNLFFQSIITINLKHIIIIALKMKKRGVDKNGRTSNTRFNEHCYE